MNSTEPEFLFSSPPSSSSSPSPSSSSNFSSFSSSSFVFTESHNLSSLLASPSLSTSLTMSPQPFEPHDPGLTIMVVLGLFLFFALFAAFLAVCRPAVTAQDGGSMAGCGPGEALACGAGLSSEPQLMLWKRLGSYRRSYSCSFRRPPPHRSDRNRDRNRDRDHDPDSTQLSPLRPPDDSGPQDPPLATTPCLFDYVTEI